MLYIFLRCFIKSFWTKLENKLRRKMANQSATISSNTSENFITNKGHSEMKPTSADKKKQQQRSPLTFYQPHLCQPPKDYRFLEDKPAQNSLQQPNKLNSSQQFPAISNIEANPTLNKQITNIQHQRLNSGACYSVFEETENSFERYRSEHSRVCSTNEIDSNESVKELRHTYLNESFVPVAVATAPKEHTQVAIEDAKNPLTYIKFFEEGTFVPGKSNASQEPERKPAAVERGYILWELQSAGNDVLHLEMKMERTIEELTAPTLDNDATKANPSAMDATG